MQCYFVLFGNNDMLFSFKMIIVRKTVAMKHNTHLGIADIIKCNMYLFS